MIHKHKDEAGGKQSCCALDEKTDTKTDDDVGCCSSHGEPENHSDDGHDHDHSNYSQSVFGMFVPSIISLVVLLIALLFDNFFPQSWFSGWIRIVWYIVAYIPVGLPVLKEAFESIRKGDIFSEFFLMGIATIGAFGIGQYAEGVAVMLFYSIGELFQMLAVKRAKSSIKSLLDQRPDSANVVEGFETISKKASDIGIGEIIQLKQGEKLALDGKLLSDYATFNTAALTGESKPDTKRIGEMVLAGMINLNAVAQVEVTAVFTDSKLSRILEMVQEATAKKATTELFIRKFAKIYTPIVVFLAIGICLIPLLFVADYVFKDWLYRALIFLVISCPCALVISIPLGYFGGIGAASKNGILIKGSTFLDILATIQVVVMDKTGTLTKGVFKVQKVVAVGISEADLVKYTATIETKSTHPVGSAIIEYAKNIVKDTTVTEVKEIAGHGMKGLVDGKEILVGSAKLMKKFNISYNTEIDTIPFTIIVVAINQKYVGYFVIADEIKEDAKEAIQSLHKLNIKTVMLSGDNQAIVSLVAKELNIDQAFGGLLPEDKVQKVSELKEQNLKIIFVGDGVNDAPVIASADVGIAMGGLGSDATIETADVVIQNDQPTKIFTAINIGKKTKQIVWQNIGLAFSVKVIVLVMGAGGLATMWEAVFADVGVALLAILNAVRIQRMKF
ncbi:heavy metal translocating P-type ATPase [Flavobacterium gawalongense]|uniref:P-type Zn(2+) transporter n=1 Tax=Flavobacterium gawalongense TaxID=2594432 RepID=A0A553BLH2_9FLAO|nr:heavy metal translocating P-type ATPase [Flavobacterium gawalongense]TRX00849.1 cadmium-translocating P-type ATPase [Flavobacterium gawalongense]TRX05150.1 cadmium-translocating P-type ATPase [Flavobacterium gawalongense]TRX09071.1 cadmium-translocating P-type ATPase [Flavobacterium gawalongense]TRX10206.1 cadmium-translocating P-type ATPase [Flavobacterium gawalongense]TRX27126.1 cadmium-translocating P-type ATPase [Flavobacterium gawalongense]